GGPKLHHGGIPAEAQREQPLLRYRRDPRRRCHLPQLPLAGCRTASRRPGNPGRPNVSGRGRQESLHPRGDGLLDARLWGRQGTRGTTRTRGTSGTRGTTWTAVTGGGCAHSLFQAPAVSYDAAYVSGVTVRKSDPREIERMKRL